MQYRAYILIILFLLLTRCTTDNLSSDLYHAIINVDKIRALEIVSKNKVRIKKIIYSNKYTPLTLAIQRNIPDIVSALLNTRIFDLNYCQEEDEITLYPPLHLAVELQNIRIARLLLNEKNIDVNLIFNRDTPLLLAIKSKNSKIIDMLLEDNRYIPSTSELELAKKMQEYLLVKKIEQVNNRIFDIPVIRKLKALMLFDDLAYKKQLEQMEELLNKQKIKELIQYCSELPGVPRKFLPYFLYNKRFDTYIVGSGDCKSKILFDSLGRFFFWLKGVGGPKVMVSVKQGILNYLNDKFKVEFQYEILTLFNYEGNLTNQSINRITDYEMPQFYHFPFEKLPALIPNNYLEENLSRCDENMRIEVLSWISKMYTKGDLEWTLKIDTGKKNITEKDKKIISEIFKYLSMNRVFAEYKTMEYIDSGAGFDGNNFDLLERVNLERKLIEAVKKGDLETVQILSIYNFSPDTKFDGVPALVWAAYTGHLHIAKYLIEKNADINITDKDGDTPLHAAIFSNQYNIVEYLLKSGKIKIVKNFNGLTPLDAAIKTKTTIIDRLRTNKISRYQYQTELSKSLKIINLLKDFNRIERNN